MALAEHQKQQAERETLKAADLGLARQQGTEWYNDRKASWHHM